MGVPNWQRSPRSSPSAHSLLRCPPGNPRRKGSGAVFRSPAAIRKGLSHDRVPQVLRCRQLEREASECPRSLQGCFWYGAIPAMPDDRLKLLMDAYAEVVAEHAVFTELFGVL